MEVLPVKRLAFAAAIAATTLAAPLASAQSRQHAATQPLSPAPAASSAAVPAAPEHQNSAPMPGRMGPGVAGMPGQMPENMMMQRRMMMHRMMMQRMMMQGMMPGMMGHAMMRRHNPKEACFDRLARRAGMLAYLRAKLNLNPQQRPLWQKLQKTARDEARSERQLCEAMKPAGAETALDRLGHMEQMAATRLAGLKQAIPELRQLYQALTPQQRATLDHPFHG